MSTLAVKPTDFSSLSWGYDYPQEPVIPQDAPPVAIAIGPGELPQWLAAAATRINDLAALPPDPRGSRPLNVHDVLDALSFLTAVMNDNLVAPWIGRLNSGGLQLTWEKDSVEVEAVFDRARDERIVMFAIDGNERDTDPVAGERLFASITTRLLRDHSPQLATA